MTAPKVSVKIDKLSNSIVNRVSGDIFEGAITEVKLKELVLQAKEIMGSLSQVMLR
jgi:CRISPR/Cas system-associated endoribonuclease Cas2